MMDSVVTPAGDVDGGRGPRKPTVCSFLQEEECINQNSRSERHFVLKMVVNLAGIVEEGEKS